ncbi:MAG: glycosyltransferase family 2 protein [Candidatus Uhrbacteria bacterium]|nr:glycosyltransferase family 2 protein [Candidatus Uhrbacteria bacterium]
MSEVMGQYGKHRFWEMIPGLLIWTTFVLAIYTSFFIPVAAVAFIIIFDLYWTLRVLYFLIHLTAAYFQYKHEIAVNWEDEYQKLNRSDKIYHLVIFPTYKEELSILQGALRAVAQSKYRKDRFIVMVGGEEGDEHNFNRYAKALKEEFGNTFAALEFTMHPRGIKGEIPGKGSNLKWMATRAKEIINERKIPYKDIIVSAFDVDTIAHVQYFARLSYLYLTIPNPTRTSFQPLTLFSNNIWDATAPVRVAAFGTTFWLLSELVRPERMWTFSSHSMPWQMLVDVGYWEPDLVSEDSRIFMQALLHYKGEYRVTPVFLPVNMDTVTGKTYYESLVALYKQQRRWAWGVEHLPYMLEHFRGNKDISRRIKLKFIFNHIEGMYTWATAPILIFMLGYLPFFLVGNSPTAFVANSPFTLELMMQVATAGVFASAFLSLLLLPHRPECVKKHNWLVMILQWALLPVTFVLFGAFPAIDAQTRMMIGKYLGFNVTKKKR